MNCHSALPLLAALVTAGLSSTSTPAQALRLEPGTRAVEWNIWSGTNKVLAYAFDSNKYKPYVRELRTIKGENVLRDAPFDHLHHHALMYGIKVNGLNFWEETAGNGVQKPVQSPPPVLLSGSDGKATIAQVIHWLRPDDAFLPDTAPVALLVERRTLTLSVNPGENEVALDWKSEFEVGRKTNTVTLSGANYHGLGVRFRKDLDALAVHSIGGQRIDLSNNRQDISAAAWGSVAFNEPGHAAMLVIGGGPSNVGGQATFFSMKTPFAYLSATQGLDQAPLVYHTGDKFTLHYVILVYDEVRTSAELNNRLKAWTAGARTAND